MIASLQHAVNRTVAMHDQLGVLWGPEAHPNLSVHGVSHEQVHELGGRASVFLDPAYPGIRRFVASTVVSTPMGWEIWFFADAQPSSCELCYRLATNAVEHAEALQLAGVVDRMDGGGL